MKKIVYCICPKTHKYEECIHCPHSVTHEEIYNYLYDCRKNPIDIESVRCGDRNFGKCDEELNCIEDTIQHAIEQELL